MVADGLISASEARNGLERIAATLNRYEAERTSSPLTSGALREPQAAWFGWTTTQRREVIRILFESVEVQHARVAKGPRVDLSRVKLLWRH